MYLRFIVTSGHKSKTRCTGVVVALSELKESGVLANYHEEFAEEVFRELNQKLPVPPFNYKNWKGCVCWFKGSASEIIGIFGDIVYIPEEHDLNVLTLTEHRPGMIVYEDDFQIVAKSREYYKGNAS